jgi:hypothetical protein
MVEIVCVRAALRSGHTSQIPLRYATSCSWGNLRVTWKMNVPNLLYSIYYIIFRSITSIFPKIKIMWNGHKYQQISFKSRVFQIVFLLCMPILHQIYVIILVTAKHYFKWPDWERLFNLHDATDAIYTVDNGQWKHPNLNHNQNCVHPANDFTTSEAKRNQTAKETKKIDLTITIKNQNFDQTQNSLTLPKKQKLVVFTAMKFRSSKRSGFQYTVYWSMRFTVFWDKDTTFYQNIGKLLRVLRLLPYQTPAHPTQKKAIY